MLVKITDDIGRDITLDYENGLLDSITDFAGRMWHYQYEEVNDANELAYVTSPPADNNEQGLTVSYFYDQEGRHNLTEYYDANENTVVVNSYEVETDRIASQQVGNGSYLFDYNDAQNSTVTIKDREGVRTDMVYNERGQLVSHRVYTVDGNAQPNSFTTTYLYDANTSQRTWIIFPKGDCYHYTYNSRGNLTAIYHKTSTDEPNDFYDPNVIATIYSYDETYQDSVSGVLDPMGNLTIYLYDWPPNAVVGIIYPEVDTPDGPKTPTVTMTYDSYGRMETTTDPNGMETKFEYYTDSGDTNNYGRLWKTIVDYNTVNGLKLTTAYTYNAAGNVIEVNDPNEDISKSQYNNLDQVIKMTAPSPYEYVTKFGYDKNGNQKQIEREIGGDNEANQITKFDYNAQNKLAEVTDPLGYVTKYGYNKNDEPNSVTDAENNSTLTEYNERGMVSKVTDANGGITRFGYMANGDLNDINDPNGNITQFSYDGFGRLLKITYPDDSCEVYGYDKNRNVTAKTTRKGDTIQYQYDALNRIVVKNRPNDQTDPNINFTYDIDSRIVEVNDGRTVANGGGITKYYYDRVGRVVEVNDIYGRTVGYQYDNKGLRTRLDYPDTVQDVNYTYDAMGRVRTIYRYTYLAATYDYDELSRRKSVTYGNNIGGISYEYDIGNRLMKLTNDFYGDNNVVYDYNSYDKVGNRLSCKIGNANTQIYAYDKLYQLTAVDYNDGNSTTYDYDKLGNRASVVNGGTTGYISNALNQYESVGGANYTYDKNGNLTGDGQYVYIYDCENRLLEVKEGETTIVTYAYDYQGRRVRKTVGSTVLCYCYDGDQIIADYNEAGIWKKRYYFGPGVDEPICMVRTPGVTTYVNYYYYDGLGSVVAMSNYYGLLMEKYSYDVYGKPTIREPNDATRTTSLYGNRYMFTGREYDSETGLYYYRARYYKPSIGRFLQTDPITYQYYYYYFGTRDYLSNIKKFMQKNYIRHRPGLNLYTYVGNNPIGYKDPLGLGEGEGHSLCAEQCYIGSQNTGTSSLASCLLCCDENTSDDCDPGLAAQWGKYCWLKSIGDIGITPPGVPPISPSPQPPDTGDHMFVFMFLFALLTLLLCKLCSIFKIIVVR